MAKYFVGYCISRLGAAMPPQGVHCMPEGLCAVAGLRIRMATNGEIALAKKKIKNNEL